MNKLEWMSVNPCDDCSGGDKDEREHYYGFDNECRCQDQSKYFSERYAQRKLLEYQLTKVKAMKPSTTQTELGLWIESMLQELERK